jgi:phospholipase C
MPAQEPGVKKARPLPCQANASLSAVTANSDGTVTVSLALSNNCPHVQRASHFSVYDNTLAVAPGIPAYPVAFPGQYTVAGSAKDNAPAITVNQAVSGPAYDVTIVSANRFLRRFTGDVTKAGAKLRVIPSYYAAGDDDKSLITFNLVNNSGKAVTFTLTYNNYASAPADKIKADAHGRWSHPADDLVTAHGWYDVTVTADIDPTWSQRFIGHIENGQDSVTGSF